MKYSDFDYTWTGSHSKDWLLNDINEMATRLRAAFPLGFESSVRITSLSWSILDKDWPGGNDRQWFGATLKAGPHPTIQYHVVLDVVVFLDVVASIDN